MRSSTSNSEARGNWLRAWLLAGCLVALLLTVWEVSLRQAGLVPEFTDNRALWLSARHRLSTADTQAVAILGASRVQRAIDVDTLSNALERPVVQLAVEGSSGLPVLENLAADPRFHGTVLVSIAPPFSFNRRLSKLDAGSQAEWAKAYFDQSRSRRMEQEMRHAVQGLFAFRAADAAVLRTVPALLDSGTLPGPDYKTTMRNRLVSIDQDKFEGNATPEGVVALYKQNTEPYGQDEFANLLQYFATLVDILNAKGSRVIVLRLPSGGAVLDYENALFPQERFWDELRHRIDAEFIHFQDHPELDGFLSADGSHIAAEKATEFTLRLAAILRDKDL